MDYDEIKKTILAGAPSSSSGYSDSDESKLEHLKQRKSQEAMIELLVDMAKNLHKIANRVPVSVPGVNVRGSHEKK